MKFEELAKSFSQKNLPDSEIELTGEVPADAIEGYRQTALTQIAGELSLPGFRKGHVPPAMALKQVGEVAILEEAAELFVRDFYPELLQVKGIDAVGRPEIKVTKLAPGNPVGLTIVAATYPEVTLPKDWKKIADQVPLEPSSDATDEEVNKTVEDLRQSRAKPSELFDAEGKPLPPTLPELTDEFAKSLGAFDTIDDLKKQIRKGIGEEKARSARDVRRGKIIDALLEKTEVAIPRVFVESELDKIMAQMQEDIARMGLDFNEYLKKINKTEADIRGDFKQQAHKRAKLQLTLNKIASEEKIEADKEAVDHEMEHAQAHFPDANKALLRIHIESVMRNEQVLRMLEGNKDPLPVSDHKH